MSRYGASAERERERESERERERERERAVGFMYLVTLAYDGACLEDRTYEETGLMRTLDLCGDRT